MFQLRIYTLRSAQALRALGFVNAPATAQRALLHLDSWEINPVPYRERRDMVMDRVRADGLDAIEPQGGLYLWLRSPWPDTLQLIDALTARRVLLTRSHPSNRAWLPKPSKLSAITRVHAAPAPTKKAVWQFSLLWSAYR